MHPKAPFSKEQNILDDTGQFFYEYNYGKYPDTDDYYYGLMGETIYSSSSSNGTTFNHQDEMRELTTNTSCTKLVRDALIKVKRIQVKAEYLKKDIWFAYQYQDRNGFSSIRLIKDFIYKEEDGTVEIRNYYSTIPNKIISVNDIIKMYYPIKPEKDYYEENSMKIILEAKSIIEKHSKEMSNRSRLNDKRFVQVIDSFLDKCKKEK